ncbi:5'/3'-nucleotidase SurE [Streptomyces sp. NPDC048191]|uniref:5'/3'-nucleotidase SurE n=1 Tax=Streptomyces sp. NPDC048191 TaxID=3155484 RepID=UPI0033F3189E
MRDIARETHPSSGRLRPEIGEHMMDRRSRIACLALSLAALGVAGPSVAVATGMESHATAAEARPSCRGPLDVLLTNDDGWSAPGIQAVYTALKAAGNRVTMVAPLKNQSGMSSRIAYGEVLEVTHPVATDDDILAVDGSPTDAVAFALYTLPADRYPDVVVSGTNYGQNTSRVTNHSDCRCGNHRHGPRGLVDRCQLRGPLGL